MSPLRRTCKSLSQLARALVGEATASAARWLASCLRGQKCSLQANPKTREGDGHPDRDAQFRHLNESARTALAAGEQVISADTKKKALVGDFKNAGRARRPQGEPEEIRVHNSRVSGLGRAVPFASTTPQATPAGSALARATTGPRSRYWRSAAGGTGGRLRYPDARRLTMTADGGGGNARACGCGSASCKAGPDELGIAIAVRHLPPGTSKWNKIEHRPFLLISMSRRARPLVSHRVTVDLIAATATATGLTVRRELDGANDAMGVLVPTRDTASLHITHAAFTGRAVPYHPPLTRAG